MRTDGTGRGREFAVGVALALLMGSALVMTELVLFWPTSHYRARLYWLLWVFPFSLGVIHLGLVLIAPLLTAMLTGWRNRWTGVGIVLGGVVVMVAMYLGLFSYTVWLHDEDIPAWGQEIRLMIAAYVVIGTGMAALWYRRGITGLSNAGPFFRS